MAGHPPRESGSSSGNFLWRQANEEELQIALGEAGERLSPRQARLVLRNPFLSVSVLEKLLGLDDLAGNYQWRRDLANTRICPLTAAMAIVPGLFWRDLAQMARNVQVRPQLRRQAESVLLQRVDRLGAGERIALARIASPALLVELRKATDPRVIRSLLENPRLTQGDLMPLLVGGRGTASTLRLIARDRRWGTRRSIRLALARNPNTPLSDALSALPSLTKPDLRGLSRDAAVPSLVRRRCHVLLGEEP